MSAPPHDFCPVSVRALHATFLAILPRITEYGKVYFRHLKCPHAREEALAEMRAPAWLWFVRLAERGKDATQFVSALATFAARAVRSGRKVSGMDCAKDVLSPRAQQRHGFAVCTLPNFSTLNGSPIGEALQDNTRSEVPEAVAFKLDFPRWRASLCRRDRLMLGEHTGELARKFRLSASRVSQLRRQFHDDWQFFTADPQEDTRTRLSGLPPSSSSTPSSPSTAS
jgi:hypothetical protein